MRNSCKEPILEWIEKQKNKFPFLMAGTRIKFVGPHLGPQASFFNLEPGTTPKTSLRPITDSSPDINLNPGDRAQAGMPRAARRRTGSRGPGPGPSPGRPAQKLDTATDHLTSTLATWAAPCVQVIRARVRGSPGPQQAPLDAAAPQLPGNGVALTP